MPKKWSKEFIKKSRNPIWFNIEAHPRYTPNQFEWDSDHSFWVNDENVHFYSLWPQFDLWRSLKVKSNGTKRNLIGIFLYVFNSNYAPRKHYYPDISLSVLHMNANVMDATNLLSQETQQITDVSLPIEQTLLN